MVRRKLQIGLDGISKILVSRLNAEVVNSIKVFDQVIIIHFWFEMRFHMDQGIIFDIPS